MSSFTHDLMIRGVAAARVGEKQEARFFLERLLALDAPLDEKMEAWFWLAKACDDPKEKRTYLEEVLANNLGDARARRELAILNGEIKNAEIIDPDRLKEEESDTPAVVDASRFTCPQCGGRMTYAPDGRSLTCESCESRQRLVKTVNPNQVEESDNFVAAMATARGHRKPTSTRTFHCKGCGASFILLPDLMTMICPYCQSAYVVEQAEAVEMIEPNSVIPFLVGENEVKQALLGWFKQEGYSKLPRVARGICLYLPVWLFDVGGMISWTYQVQKNRNIWETIRGQQVIFQNNLLVQAARNLSGKLDAAIRSFDLNQLVAYEKGFLVDRVAQAYQIPLGNASLEARKMAMDAENRSLRALIPSNAANLSLNTSNMIVETYQLILLPFWYTFFDQDDERINLFINGQNSRIFSGAGPVPK